MTDASQRNVMRRKLRAYRQALTPAEQNHASITLHQTALSSAHFTGASTIAFYWPIDGEINPIPLMRAALKSGKCCTLPVVPEEEEELQETMPLLEVQTKVEAVAVEVATMVQILPITMVLLVDLESLSLDT